MSLKYTIALLALFFALVGAGVPTNMTDFWQSELNLTQPLNFQAYAGYEELDWFFPDAHYFYTYWGVEERDMHSAEVPLIIFLQGGPGSASQFSAFNYIGPLKVMGSGDGLRASRNYLGWNGLGNLLVVDQPLGVGFSYDKVWHTTTTTEQAGSYFVNFMYNFFRTWNLTSETAVYLTGESYAGHYLPVFAQYLLSNRSLGISVKGISIGGAYVDSYVQDNHFDGILSSYGIVDTATSDLLTSYQVRSMKQIRNGNFAEATHIMNIISDDNNFQQKYYNGVNIVNLRQYDRGRCNYEYDTYLTRIKKQFKVIPDSVNYIHHSDLLYDAFSADLSQSKEAALLYCVARIKVMLYVGQNDGLVCSAGLQTFLNTWGWPLKENWKRAKKEFLYIGDSIYGWRKRYSRLTFALVNDAGHLAPVDNPVAIYSLLSDWLQQ